MKLKFLSQNCFLIQYKGKNIITDPFFNLKKSISGFELKAQVIDFILITHAHGDHTADVREILDAYPEAVLVGQPEICTYFKPKNPCDLNFGGSVMIEDMQLIMVSALHTSSFGDASYGGLSAGYILRTPEKTIYLAGDTGITSDMALYPKVYGPISVAILPLGGHYTMDAAQASFAANELLKCKKVIGCHFDTFPPICINHTEAINSFKQRNIELHLPTLGEEIEV